MSSDFRDKARRMSNWLWLHSTMTGLSVIVGSIAMLRDSVLSLFMIVIVGIPAVFFSAVLVFDAWLFGLIAKHENEIDGCRSVDDFLAGAGLKRRPENNRGLSSRIEGTRLVIYAQLLFAGLFAAGFLSWVRS